MKFGISKFRDFPIAIKMALIVAAVQLVVAGIQIFLQNFNIENMVNKQVSEDVANILTDTSRQLSTIEKNIIEDMTIVFSHNSINNYLDYESMGLINEANDDIGDFELFLSKFASTKYHYDDLQIVTNSGEMISIVKGVIVSRKPALKPIEFENSLGETEGGQSNQ